MLTILLLFEIRLTTSDFLLSEIYISEFSSLELSNIIESSFIKSIMRLVEEDKAEQEVDLKAEQEVDSEAKWEEVNLEVE